MPSQLAQPNIVFILADDLGYGDVGCYGFPPPTPSTVSLTPNLDALAQQAGSVRFTNAYAGSSTCTPSRCAILTGRHPARFPIGLREPLNWNDFSVGLDPAAPTIATLLKNCGYSTAMVGKWHLGYVPGFPGYGAGGTDYGPVNHGFDHFYGILGPMVDYFTHELVAGTPIDFFEYSAQNPTLTATSVVNDVGYMTTLLTQRACAWIADTTVLPRPFYLALHYTAPHAPFQSPIPGDPDTEALQYPKMVRALDAGVGDVMQALRNAGVAGSTLIIFMSDNGGGMHSVNWSDSPVNAYGQPTHGKFTLWEGGIRVPAIVGLQCYPSWAPPLADVLSNVVTATDFTSLMASLAMTPVKDTLPPATLNYWMDGTRDPFFLFGINAYTPAPLPAIPFIAQGPGHTIPGLVGDPRNALYWRTSAQNGTAQNAMRLDRWKYLADVAFQNGAWGITAERLFDLSAVATDRDQDDVSAQYPGVVAAMRQEFALWEQQPGILPRP